jgi:hypothetical protein
LIRTGILPRRNTAALLFLRQSLLVLPLRAMP